MTINEAVSKVVSASGKVKAAVGNYLTDPVLLFDNAPKGSIPTCKLLTLKEVAELFKISASGVRRLLQQRCIPFIKIGGSVRFADSDVAEYLNKRRVESIG